MAQIFNPMSSYPSSAIMCTQGNKIHKKGLPDAIPNSNVVILCTTVIVARDAVADPLSVCLYVKIYRFIKKVYV